MFKIPDINSHKYRQITYFLPWVFGLIGLCLLVVTLWHLLLTPLWEVTSSLFYILVFMVITYLVGVRAKITGNPDTIGGFYILLLWTISWSCILIGFELEFYILSWFGLGLFFITVIVSFIISWQLLKMGFYSDVPPILRAASRLNHGAKGRFSNKPYKAQIEKYNTNELNKYAKLLLKYGIALSPDVPHNNTTLNF